MSKQFAPATKVDVITSDDAQTSGIIAQTKDGVVGFAVKSKELSKLAALLIEQSQKVAVHQVSQQAKGGAPTSGRATLTLHPIRASKVGIGPGRTDAEMMLLVEVGNMSLCFALGTAALHGMCEDLHRRMEGLSKPRRPN